MHEKVCAIVVTFNPDPQDFIRCLNSYKSQVDDVIIVDNGSNLSIINEIQEQINNEASITIIRNKTNNGIASALNQGIREAMRRGYEWVITFDHDSEVENGMIDKMFKVYFKYLQDKKVGIVAPNYKDVNTGEMSPFVQKCGLGFKRVKCSGDYIEVLTVITSGSLMKTSVFKEVGFFKEELFIDYVDNEMCLRLLENGFKIYVITEAIMYHRLGKRRIYKLGPLKFIPTNHSVLRKYYIERNRIYTYKKYALKQFSWFLFDILACIYDIFKVIMFENQKFQKIKFMLKGFYHGFIGKYGKLDI